MYSPDEPLVKVLVAHAEPLLEVGIVTALSAHRDLEVSSQAGLEATRDACMAEEFDVIVADYNTALQISAIVADPRRASATRARVMVMTAHDRENEVRQALERGIYGYVLQDCSPCELADGVRTLGRGSRYLCRHVAHCIAEILTREALTSRELEVLAHLALGRSNKAIARELQVALGTVKAHVKAVLSKLGATSRTQALSIAVQRGLVPEHFDGHPEANGR